MELILSGTPHFTQVQTAPEIASGTVRVQAVLRNEGEAGPATAHFVVREAKSGRVAGRLKTETSSLAKGAETTVDVRIPIAECHLWSPEDPFLYTLEADSGTDRFQTRFGMREFRFDPATGRAMLNGKPYFMRGSNFTLYRFFEDSECKDLPWREDWVRLLHERVKDMHWNCLRYCIGFPPEAWYDIADEVGILIQDEFPIWYGGTWSTSEGTEERRTGRRICRVDARALEPPLRGDLGREQRNRPVPRPAPPSARCAAWICPIGRGTTATPRRRSRAICLSRTRIISTSELPPAETLPPPIRCRRETSSTTTASTPSSSTNTAGTGSIATARPPRSRGTSTGTCSASTPRRSSDSTIQATWLAADTEFWRAIARPPR